MLPSVVEVVVAEEVAEGDDDNERLAVNLVLYVYRYGTVHTRHEKFQSNHLLINTYLSRITQSGGSQFLSSRRTLVRPHI